MTKGFNYLNPSRFFYFITLPLMAFLLTFSYRQHFHGFIDRDTASYIEIAIKYQQANFMGAVNGYWSPLYSWLLAPLLFTGIDPDYLLGLINIVSCILIQYQLFRLAQSIKLLYYLQIILQLSFALAFAFFCFYNITPDLLHLFFLVLYLRLYLTKQLFTKPLLTGVLGAFLYFSKYYGFSFFFVHLTFVYLLQYSVEKKNILRPYGKTIFVFFILSFAWIGLLTHKYGHLTFSYAGSYNHSIMESGYINHSWQYKGFVAPAKGQLFPWEDIVRVYNYKDWSPFECKANFINQLDIIKRNIRAFINFTNADTRYGFYLNAFILFFLLIRKRSLKILADDFNIKLILFGVIYVSGYLLILLVNDRYLWLIYVVSSFSIIYFLHRVLASSQETWLHFAAIIFLAYCLNKKHLDLLMKPFPKDFDSLPINISLLKNTWQPGDRIVSYEEVTAGHFPIDTRTFYYGNCSGYRGDTTALLNDLKKFKINYVINADTIYHKAPAVFNHFEKVNKPFIGLTLYKISSNTLDSLLITATNHQGNK